MPSAHDDVYVALHNATPGSDAGSNEVTGGNYSRVQTNAGSDWDISGVEFENAVVVEFPEATEPWGTITHFSLWNGPDDSDDAIAVSPIETEMDIITGDVAVFEIST